MKISALSYPTLSHAQTNQDVRNAARDPLSYYKDCKSKATGKLKK